MTGPERERLERLTERWRARHDARRPAPTSRPAADPQREALAACAFPYLTVAPAEYVARHGADMDGFTYDDAAYADAELDAWLLEVGRLLRARRRSGAG
jgi:hypothetical protein